MKFLKKIKRCRICNSKNVSRVLNLGKSPIGENFKKKKIKDKLFNLNLQQCKNCGLCQIEDVIDPRILYKDYLYQSNTSTYLDKHFSNYAKKVSKFLKLKKNSIILDIGSNDGMLLSKFKKNGYKVIGIEPAKEIARIANNRNIQTIHSFFNDKTTDFILKKEKKISLVTANNVLANIDDINSWLKNIKKIILKDGFFVFESFYLKDVIKNKVLDFIYHEHLSIFSIKCIKYLCKLHSLKLVNVEAVNTKGGSLRYYICSKKNKFKINSSIKQFEKKEITYKCFKISTFKKLEIKINENKNKINYLLSKIKNSNDILGLGSSISCITLIYFLGIQNKLKILLDDNKIKHRMFSPGSNIRVLNPKNFKYSRNQTILILAWRFKKILLKKYRSRFKGKILNIWPKIEYEKN